MVMSVDTIWVLFVFYSASLVLGARWDPEESTDRTENTVARGYSCNENEFQCENGNCIPIENVCESESNFIDEFGKTHCGDYSDIFNCSTEPCSTRKNTCDHTCIDLPGYKSRCTCYKGYRLYVKKQNFYCVDIDECSIGNHVCSHDCKNLNGSFSCSCRNGFGKEVDERDSACKVDDGQVLIFYNSLSFIYSFNLRDRKNKLVVWSGNVDEMSYDPTTDIIYWSNENRVARSYIPGSKNGTVSVAHAQILGTFLMSDNTARNSLSVDWVGGNLFWLSSDILENDMSQIMMSKLDGRYIKTVRSIPHGTSLALEPEVSMMYWSSCGTNPKISFGPMSGHIHWLVKSVPGQKPIALTLDHQSNGRIYWVDSNTHSIYLMYKSGIGMKKIVTTSPERLPKAMDIFENNIYWVTETSNELVKHDKFGRGDTEVLVSNLINQTSIKIYHKLKYFFKSKANFSERSKCSHLYIYNQLQIFHTCYCPDGSKEVFIENEFLCNSEQIKAAEDPIICNCKEKEKVCNTSTVYRFCACGNICPDGLSVPDYNEYPQEPDKKFSTKEHIVLIILTFIVVLFFCVLLFYKIK